MEDGAIAAGVKRRRTLKVENPARDGKSSKIGVKKPKKGKNSNTEKPKRGRPSKKMLLASEARTASINIDPPTEMKRKRGMPKKVKEPQSPQDNKSINHSSVPVTPSFTWAQFIEGLKKRKFKKVAFLLGAGISCAAGIPDFRTKGAGLYSQMQQQGYPHPEELFDLECFLENPQPFYQVANRYLRFNSVQPVKAHHFVRACNDAGQLLIAFTQNIDSLELAAGLPEDKLVQAHGHMRSARCCRCKKHVDMAEFDTFLCKEEVMVCPQCSSSASGRIEDAIIKPDIIFFGEKLTKTFQNRWRKVDKANLVIVMGTSLKVKPFSELVNGLPEDIPVVVLNRENPGIVREKLLVISGDIEESISSICSELGWEERLTPST